MRRMFAATAVGVLMLMPAVALARGTMSSGFRNVGSRPMSVAVLPGRADFIQGRLVVTAQKGKDCAALEREAGVAVRTNLEMLGYRVRLLTRQDLEQDAGLRDLAARVNDQFGEAWKTLVRNPEAVNQGRAATGGDDAVRLVAALGVDGLALTRVIAVTPPEEQGAPEAKRPAKGAGDSYSRVDLGIVGKEGRIEAFFTGLLAASSGQLTGRPAKVMGRVAEEAFAQYPPASEPGRLRKEVSLPAAEQWSRGMVPFSDEAALRDFEVLLKRPPVPAGASRAQD